ncbi:MAG: hypothetical protein ABJB05_10155 [Parafilimonas sp.]
MKKKDKVLQSWFKGNNIYTQLKNGQWINAVIYNIKDDSLYLRPYVVHTYINRLGLNFLDTTYYGMMTIHPDKINAFPKHGESFSYVKNGTIFEIGGGGYLLLNIINTLSDNDPLFASGNIPKLSIATGVLALGIALGLTHKSNYIIGKKYHVEYIYTKPSS